MDNFRITSSAKSVEYSIRNLPRLSGKTTGYSYHKDNNTHYSELLDFCPTKNEDEEYKFYADYDFNIVYEEKNEEGEYIVEPTTYKFELRTDGEAVSEDEILKINRCVESIIDRSQSIEYSHCRTISDAEFLFNEHMKIANELISCTANITDVSVAMELSQKARELSDIS